MDRKALGDALVNGTKPPQQNPRGMGEYLMGIVSGMFGRGGTMNPTGPVIEPTREGVVGAVNTGAEMLNPAPGVDRSIEAFRDGRYVDAFAEGVTAVPMIATATTGRAASRLSPPRNAAERQADEVATMLRDGRAADVTDDMMARADSQRLWRLYEDGATGQAMPMDTASRMGRARDMGFDTPVYHGTSESANFHQFNTGAGGAVSVAPDAGRAGQYANSPFSGDVSPGGRVMPLRARMSGVPEYNAAGNQHYNVTGGHTQGRIRNPRFDGDPNTLMPGPSGEKFTIPAPAGMPPRQTINELALDYRSRGAPGVNVRDVVDAGSVQGRGKAGDTVMLFEPERLRSQFARFDPRLSHLRNLNAGIAPVGVGLGGLGASRLRDE